MRVLVAGAGGFIGGHLVSRLLVDGVHPTDIRAVDVKPYDQWHQTHGPDVDEWEDVDLSAPSWCAAVCRGVDEVYMLAADMGGIGFIEGNKAACMLSVLPSTHMLAAARDAGVGRFFYASSACVYPADRQRDADVVGLREEDAYPADPEDGYGWEKLFTERMCRHFREDFGLETRIGRYHNIYGPHGTWHGGREKAPAAICRKVAAAALTGQDWIDIWGDGEQTRSFCYVADCVEGTLRLARSECPQPVNIGSEELVTINQLVSIVEETAGVTLERRYDLDAPQGVRGRNSDNTLVHATLGWAPSVTLRAGIEETYAWVHDQVKEA